MIIDNASEEQGNSDQSIEKIVMISEDFINRIAAVEALTLQS